MKQKNQQQKEAERIKALGTQKKNIEIKDLLRNHSIDYLRQREQKDKDGNTIMASDFEMDLLELDANQRVAAEIKILEFHQAKPKAIDLSVSLSDSEHTIEDRLRALCVPAPQKP